MSKVITKEMREIMSAINGTEYKQRLIDKARWEGMSTWAVLAEWGDPRTWDTGAKP